MNNIVTYLEDFGHLSFEEMPFNETDALLLCQMSYLDFKDFVAPLGHEEKTALIGDIVQSPDFEKIFEGYLYHDDNVKLMMNAASSKRFENLKLMLYSVIYDEKEDAQFAAVTYILPDKSVFIAYRGTDITLLGWKEDMKLGYSKPIKSHELALGYLKNVSMRFSGSFRIGGHSKGGNLALYAAMNAPTGISDRIIDIYDFDGPGFRPEILEDSNFSLVKDRVHKFIPKSSIVGIILEDRLDYEVIESWSVGTLQHNTYTWKTRDGKLVRSSGRTETKTVSDRALNEWILSLSEEEVDVFIDVLFEMLTASDAKSIFDLTKDPKRSISSAFGAYKDLSQETKEALANIWIRLISIVGENAMEEWLLKKRSFREGMKTWQEDASALMSQVRVKKKP